MTSHNNLKKILMVHDTIDPLHGGSIERSMQVSKSLAERGYQIDLLSLKRNFNFKNHIFHEFCPSNNGKKFQSTC